MQLKNIQRISGFIPQNIRFLTYARLILMVEAEVMELKPDFIILDEFHRYGAEEWQRDMANELFDGCVAHQMTLCEVIARDCLPAPKYIISYYSCQKDLERYVRRARRTGAAVQ